MSEKKLSEYEELKSLDPKFLEMLDKALRVTQEWEFLDDSRYRIYDGVAQGADELADALRCWQAHGCPIKNKKPLVKRK